MPREACRHGDGGGGGGCSYCHQNTGSRTSCFLFITSVIDLIKLVKEKHPTTGACLQRLYYVDFYRGTSADGRQRYTVQITKLQSYQCFCNNYSLKNNERKADLFVVYNEDADFDLLALNGVVCHCTYTWIHRSLVMAHRPQL